MIPGVRRIRALIAERRIDEALMNLFRHGAEHCGGSDDGCAEWDRRARALDAAYDRFNEISQA